MKPIFSKTIQHTGPTDKKASELFPNGISNLTTNEILTMAYISEDGEVLNMFALDPGTHKVRVPSNVSVIVSTSKNTKWSVRWPSRWEPADSTRIAAALVRPLTPLEEMQDYLNITAARALAGENARKLKAGEATMDFSQDDYSEDHEDDHDSPLSIHQMELIMGQLQQDLRQSQKTAQSTPAEPQTPTRGDGNPNQTDIEDNVADQKQPNESIGETK